MGLKSTAVGAVKGRGRVGMILLVGFAVAFVAPLFTFGWAWLMGKVKRGPAGTATTSTPTEG